MIFLHCYNVHCFPKIKSKRKPGPVSSPAVLLSDVIVMFAERSQFEVAVGIPNTTVRR